MAFPFLHFPFFLNKIFSCSIQDVKVCMLLSSKGFQGKQPFSNIQISGKINWYLFFQLLYFILQFSPVAQSCPTLCDPMDCNMPGLPIHHQLLEFTQTHIHWVGDAIQPSHPLSSPSPPAFNLSQHQVFSNELVLCIRWPKYWRFSFSISPSSEYSGLISMLELLFSYEQKFMI